MDLKEVGHTIQIAGVIYNSASDIYKNFKLIETLDKIPTSFTKMRGKKR